MVEGWFQVCQVRSRFAQALFRIWLGDDQDLFRACSLVLLWSVLGMFQGLPRFCLRWLPGFLVNGVGMCRVCLGFLCRACSASVWIVIFGLSRLRWGHHNKGLFGVYLLYFEGMIRIYLGLGYVSRASLVFWGACWGYKWGIMMGCLCYEGMFKIAVCLQLIEGISFGCVAV